MVWKEQDFAYGLEAIRRVNPSLASDLERMVGGNGVPEASFLEASYGYGEPLLKQGVWNGGGCPEDCRYASMPVGVVIQNEVEVNYHYRRDPRYPVSTRSREAAGSMLGAFEVLDGLSGGLKIEEGAKPQYEAWNVCAGCVGFRFFSCRKPYRQKLTSLLPMIEPEGLEDENWSLQSLRQKVHRERKERFNFRGNEPPESRYLQFLERHHGGDNGWQVKVLYFRDEFFTFLMEQTDFVKRLAGEAWEQSKEKRAFADVALHLGPMLADFVSQVGTALASHLYQVLFNFLLLSRGVGMGFCPILEEDDLHLFSTVAPFYIYEHPELAYMRRPVILLPESLENGGTLILPLDQATAHGMIEPKISWKREIFEPAVQIILSLADAGAINLEENEIAVAHLPKRGDLTIEQFGGSNPELEWLNDVELDRHGRTFLTIRRLVGPRGLEPRTKGL